MQDLFFKQGLDKVLAVYPQLLTLYDLIRDFKVIFAAHHVDDLEQWMNAANALGIPDINSFVNGLTRDIHAVELMNMSDIAGSNLLGDKAYGTRGILA